MLPNYFNLWLKGCEYNKNIDFLIFTDQKINNPPSNVRVETFTLKELKEKIIEKLKMPNISLETPYKCCDYRPAYGVIFEEYIKGYLYWGHCDLDMIFGDLEYYFDKYKISEYDKFLPLGHLSLYKNSPEVNERYKCDGGKRNYKKAFFTSKSCIFDESGGMIGIYLNNNFPMFKKKVFADITPIYKRFRLSEFTLDNEIIKNYKQQIFYWENGHVYRDYYDIDGELCREEFMYIHFQKRPNFVVNDYIMGCNSFYITPYGFIEKKGNSSKEVIKELNNYSKLKESFEFGLEKYKVNELRYHIRKFLKIIKRIKNNE